MEKKKIDLLVEIKKQKESLQKKLLFLESEVQEKTIQSNSTRNMIGILDQLIASAEISDT